MPAEQYEWFRSDLLRRTVLCRVAVIGCRCTQIEITIWKWTGDNRRLRIKQLSGRNLQDFGRIGSINIQRVSGDPDCRGVQQFVFRPADMNQILTKVISIDEAPETIRDIEKNPGDYMKVVVRIADDPNPL